MSEAIRKHPVVLSFVAMLLLATAILWLATSTFNTPTAVANEEERPTPTVEDILNRAGLDPVSLCALGIDAEKTNAVILACGAKANAIDGQLAIKDDALATARTDLIALRSKAQSGIASSDDLIQLASTSESADRLRTDVDGLLASVVEMSDHILTDTQSASLAALRANRDTPLPIEFRTIGRSDEDHAELHDALSQESFAATQGDEMDPAMQSRLSSERGASAVQLATASLATGLPAIQDAWNIAVASYD